MRRTVPVLALITSTVLTGCAAVGSPKPRETWTDRAGGTVVAYAGESHCDWQSATILRLDDNRQYVRDPEGVVEKQWLASTYDPRATLPGDAVDTGYTHDGRRLWLAVDKSAAFVVGDTGTEQRPRTLPGWGCD